MPICLVWGFSRRCPLCPPSDAKSGEHTGNGRPTQLSIAISALPPLSHHRERESTGLWSEWVTLCYPEDSNIYQVSFCSYTGGSSPLGKICTSIWPGYPFPGVPKTLTCWGIQGKLHIRHEPHFLIFKMGTQPYLPGSATTRHWGHVRLPELSPPLEPTGNRSSLSFSFTEDHFWVFSKHPHPSHTHRNKNTHSFKTWRPRKLKK